MNTWYAIQYEAIYAGQQQAICPQGSPAHVGLLSSHMKIASQSHQAVGVDSVEEGLIARKHTYTTGCNEHLHMHHMALAFRKPEKSAWILINDQLGQIFVVYNFVPTATKFSAMWEG